LIKAKQVEIKDLQNNFNIDNFTNANDINSAISNYNQKKEKLSTDLKDLKKRKSSHYRAYMREYIKLENNHYFKFGRYKSRAFFDVLYDNDLSSFKALNNTGFNIGDKSGSLYSELASDQLWIFRVSLVALVASSSKDSTSIAKSEEAFQRLVSSGGNTVLKFEYPLVYLHNQNNSFNFISRFIAKGTADFEQFGTETEDWAGSASLGLDTYLDFSTDENKFRFFASGSLYNIYGTETFNTNLGVPNKSFTFGQLKVGLIYNNAVSFSFILGTFSSESSLENRSVLVGGQIFN